MWYVLYFTHYIHTATHTHAHTRTPHIHTTTHTLVLLICFSGYLFKHELSYQLRRRREVSFCIDLIVWLFWFFSFPHNSWLFINISLTVSGLSTLWRQTGSEDSRFPPVAGLLHSSKCWGNHGNWLRNKEVFISSLKCTLIQWLERPRCGAQLQIAAFPMLKSLEETHLCELQPSPSLGAGDCRQVPGKMEVSKPNKMEAVIGDIRLT